MVESVRKEQENIEADFEQYGKNLKSIDSDAYDKLLESYEGMKYEIENLMAYSGNDEKESAFALANGTIREYGNNIQSQIDIMSEKANQSAENSSKKLHNTYTVAVFTNTVAIILSIFSVLAAFYCVFILVIRKLNSINREVHDIITAIDKKEGDLTKRITISLL